MARGSHFQLGADWIGDLQVSPLIGDLAASGSWFSEICSARVSTLTCWARLWVLSFQWSSWLLVGTGLPMRCFSPCTTTICVFAICERVRDTVFSFLFMYATVVMSSILRRIYRLNFSWAKFELLDASSSRQLMWMVYFWGDQGPQVDFPLQVIPQPCSEVSKSIAIIEAGEISFSHFRRWGVVPTIVGLPLPEGTVWLVIGSRGSWLPGIASWISGVSGRTVVPSVVLGWLHLACPGIELVIGLGCSRWPEGVMPPLWSFWSFLLGVLVPWTVSPLSSRETHLLARS